MRSFTVNSAYPNAVPAPRNFALPAPPLFFLPTQGQWAVIAALVGLIGMNLGAEGLLENSRLSIRGVTIQLLEAMIGVWLPQAIAVFYGSCLFINALFPANNPFRVRRRKIAGWLAMAVVILLLCYPVCSMLVMRAYWMATNADDCGFTLGK
jgi:hypothetical protein